MAGSEETPAPDGPTLRELVLRVVSACRDRKGLSYCALKMALASEEYEFKLHVLKRTVLNLVKRGELVQANKCGLNGRFKVPKPERGAKKKKEAKAKKGSDPEEKKEKKKPNKQPNKPNKPRKSKGSVVVTLE